MWANNYLPCLDRLLEKDTQKFFTTNLEWRWQTSTSKPPAHSYHLSRTNSFCHTPMHILLADNARVWGNTVQTPHLVIYSLQLKNVRPMCFISVKCQLDFSRTRKVSHLLSTPTGIPVFKRNSGYYVCWMNCHTKQGNYKERTNNPPTPPPGHLSLGWLPLWQRPRRKGHGLTSCWTRRRESLVSRKRMICICSSIRPKKPIHLWSQSRPLRESFTYGVLRKGIWDTAGALELPQTK